MDTLNLKEGQTLTIFYVSGRIQILRGPIQLVGQGYTTTIKTANAVLILTNSNVEVVEITDVDTA